MTFFSLFATGLSCVFYGLVATAVVMAVVYAVLRALSSSIVRSVPFYVTGAVMAVLLTIQFSLMIGAMEAKSAADSAEIYLNQLLENSYGTVGAQDSQAVLDKVTEEFPIIGTYLGVADFSGHDISQLAGAMHETMISYLNSYIWHRVWWLLGIVVVAVVIVMVLDKPNAQATSRRTSALADRHAGRHGRSGDHQRVSRRRR